MIQDKFEIILSNFIVLTYQVNCPSRVLKAKGIYSHSISWLKCQGWTIKNWATAISF